MKLDAALASMSILSVDYRFECACCPRFGSLPAQRVRKELLYEILVIRYLRFPEEAEDLPQIVHPWNLLNLVTLDAHPLPMYGILVAMTVMNCTLASSGSPAM
jgi:hypothetical protein